MRGYTTLIVLAGLLLLAGAAAAQNAPCPDCDPDGPGDANDSYHSVDAGLIDENETEALADTDASYAHEDSEKGFWLWFSLCLSAFVDDIEEMLHVHTDVDANVDVYAESNGVDVDASVVGTQDICDAAGVQTECEFDFDESELGDLDGATWETIAQIEAETGQDVFVPAVAPFTGNDDLNACVYADLSLC
ncbi:MAG TPA: hypothetical protein VM370_06505 [Candidatus Thermoplasmatota archaeon]|nr:hypothetical protein [Candidatus Thermoplasmatota archaeon]